MRRTVKKSKIQYLYILKNVKDIRKIPRDLSPGGQKPCSVKQLANIFFYKIIVHTLLKNSNIIVSNKDISKRLCNNLIVKIPKIG